MIESTDYILPNPDFEASIFFLSAAEGGRITPVANGYHGQFYYNGKNWDAQQKFMDANSCAPESTINALVQTASPANHTGKLFAGQLFEVREGATTVGIGENGHP